MTMLYSPGAALPVRSPGPGPCVVTYTVGMPVRLSYWLLVISRVLLMVRCLSV